MKKHSYMDWRKREKYLLMRLYSKTHSSINTVVLRALEALKILWAETIAPVIAVAMEAKSTNQLK